MQKTFLPFFLAMLLLAVALGGCVNCSVNDGSGCNKTCSTSQDCKHVCPAGCINKAQPFDGMDAQCKMQVGECRCVFGQCVFEEQKPCTEEAKVCPDGTTVSRNLALGCEFDDCPEADNVWARMSIFPDRYSYRSGETAIVTLEVSSARSADAVVNIWSSSNTGVMFIDESREVQLKPGSNDVEFSILMPFCTSGCGGVFPGLYTLNASVESGGKVVAVSETTIELLEE